MLLFALHPRIVDAGSQLFPGIFSICYVLGAIWFMALYSKSNQRTAYLILSAVFLFLAWGAQGCTHVSGDVS